MAKKEPVAREYLFDVRLQARSLAKQLIDSKTLEARLDALPDLQGEIDTINVEQLTSNASSRRRRNEGDGDA